MKFCKATSQKCLLLEDHQLFLITYKTGFINEGVSGKITQNCIKIALLQVDPIRISISIHCGFWSQP